VLRASELIVTRALDELTVAGVVAAERGQMIRYSPTSVKLAEMVMLVDRFYVRAPDKVRRIIATARAGALEAFADAFGSGGIRNDDVSAIARLSALRRGQLSLRLYARAQLSQVAGQPAVVEFDPASRC